MNASMSCLHLLLASSSIKSGLLCIRSIMLNVLFDIPPPPLPLSSRPAPSALWVPSAGDCDDCPPAIFSRDDAPIPAAGRSKIFPARGDMTEGEKDRHDDNFLIFPARGRSGRGKAPMAGIPLGACSVIA